VSHIQRNGEKEMNMAHKLTRRRFLEVAGTIAGSFALAGCSPKNQDPNSIYVGVMGPYTGDVAQYGLAVRSGILLYLKEFNKNGGAGGRQIVPIAEDEKGDSTEAILVYNKLLDENVCAILGDVTSTPTIALAQKSVLDNIPCVTASATAEDVVAHGNNMFRATVTDPFQGVVLAEFAKKQGYQRVGTIFNSGGDYEIGVNNAFVQRARELGIEVVSQQGYPTGAVDFNAQLTSIIGLDPDAILAPNYYQDNGKIVTQARQLGCKKPFMGADGWAGIIGGEQDYASAADLEGCFYCSAFVASNPDEKVQHFVKAYTEEYGEAPTNFCSLGYDAAMILCSALKTVEKRGYTYNSNEYRQAIIDAIASGVVEGVTGTLSYQGTGDPVKSTLIITFKDGKESIYDTINPS